MPSQPSAPPINLPQPEYPFQQIVSDYFQEQGHHYLVIADRFSGWPTVLFCGGSTSSSKMLIDTLKTYFSTYGIPEELSTDGGKTYMAYETQKFLSDYGVHHRLSSVAYPHSNQRAELAVKSMKRLLRENVSLDGKLNTDRFQRAVMQYRNTPDRDTGRSPAQVIFGRELRDFLPAPLSRYKPQKRWLLLQEDREMALRKRALRDMEKLSSNTRQLPSLKVNDTVQIQNQIGFKSSRWDITGVVVEVKNYDQYLVRVHGSGRLTLRNRKFLKKIVPYGHSDNKKIPGISPFGQELKPQDNTQILKSQLDLQDNCTEELERQESQEFHRSIPTEESQFSEVPISPGEPQPSEVPSPSEEPQIRRSSRIRKEPERLNIQSWNGQSYQEDVSVVHSNQSRFWIKCGHPFKGTAPCSVALNLGLHHNVPGGGGGIAGYNVGGCYQSTL